MSQVIDMPVDICRSAQVPDPLRISRIARAPELGPRLLFFSGGTALGPLSRTLKQFTHNSIHLITAFDSGGSSARLRSTFKMLSIGDLRSRLVALADESVRGNPEIYALFCYRLDAKKDLGALWDEFESMVHGDHPLVRAIPDTMQRIARTNLRFFYEYCPSTFDLKGANIGNLLLAGSYLSNDRDIESVLFMFSQLLGVRGTVMPVVNADLHLAVKLASGKQVVGQHAFTGKHSPPLAEPILDLYLVQSLEEPELASVEAGAKAAGLIEAADLVCYPFGSFYSSVLAPLLPRGLGRGVAATRCPKVLLPNVTPDPEQLGMTLSGCVEKLTEIVRRDAAGVAVTEVVNLVLLDTRHFKYAIDLDLARLRQLGVEVIDTDLAGSNPGRYPSSQRVVEALLSLT